LRFAPPQPLESRIALHEVDKLILRAINTHGYLPSNYLFEFVKGQHKNKNAFQYRLTKLYNGSRKDLPLLSRPPQQYQSFSARYQHLIYDLTKVSVELLEEEGVRIIHRSDPFIHRFMGACVSFSIAQACDFIPLGDILRHEKCPRSTRELENPFAVDVGKRKLVPDNLFGIRYKDGSVRFFAVEIDRKNEPVDRTETKAHQTDFGKKLELYTEAMNDKVFQKHFGIPNLMVLTVTTNVKHMENLQAHLQKFRAGDMEKRFLFKAKPTFGLNWEVPVDVMTDLVTESWSRAGGAFDISRP
jgi:hypothetical protein